MYYQPPPSFTICSPHSLDMFYNPATFGPPPFISTSSLIFRNLHHVARKIYLTRPLPEEPFI